jgi:hypothetical protein
LLASGRILNFLNNSLQERLLLVAAIIPMIIFWMQNAFCYLLYFPQNYSITITPSHFSLCNQVLSYSTQAAVLNLLTSVDPTDSLLEAAGP